MWNFNQSGSSLVKDDPIHFNCSEPNYSFYNPHYKNRNKYKHNYELENYLIDQICVSDSIQYGEYENDLHYLTIFQLLMNSTDETQNREQFFKELINSRVVKTDEVLEVGCGSGNVTKIISEPFKNITVVDTNAESLKSLVKEDFPNAESLTKINQPIENIILRNKAHDLIVASHVLYYIKQSLWVSALKRLYSSIKIDGKLVIVISGGLDKSALQTAFGGNTVDIDKLKIDCMREFGAHNIEVIDNIEVCKTDNLTSALHIAGMYLNDASATATKNELSEHLFKNNFRAGNFEFDFIQRFILISK